MVLLPHRHDGSRFFPLAQSKAGTGDFHAGRIVRNAA
jgi:hypothetical protein